jgi:hypothetical protein
MKDDISAEDALAQIALAVAPPGPPIGPTSPAEVVKMVEAFVRVANYAYKKRASLAAFLGLEAPATWDDVERATATLLDREANAAADARGYERECDGLKNEREELLRENADIRRERDEALRLLRSKTILCEAQQDTFREAIRQRDAARGARVEVKEVTRG